MAEFGHGSDTVSKRPLREARGATPQGRQFHAKAESDLKAGNLAGAIQNLQMALTFEAGNLGFKALVAELRERKKASS